MNATRTQNLLDLREEDLCLATDLYQLTMAAGYHSLGALPRGTFELFVRALPVDRKYLVFAGLDQALAAVEQLRFGPSQVDYLRGLPQFQHVEESFFDDLRRFRFRGDIRAMREGTLFFPNEPVLQVTGTLLEAQILETLLLNIINFQTAVASKAARMRLAAGDGLSLAEFGGRRAHGPQAAAWVARAAYLAGFDATSNLLAGSRLGIPVVGTMAHSYVLAFESEEAAFRHYQSLFPEHTIYLVDTYDTLAGVHKAIATGLPFEGIRLDSGNLRALSRGARSILDEAGLRDVKIFASGDLDEYRIEDLRKAQAPIDAYGIGTRLAAVSDAPYLSGVYKLVEVEKEGRRQPKAKTSAGKPTYPWRKQILRRFRNGRLSGDRIVRSERAVELEGEPLLRTVFSDGERRVRESLEESRAHCRGQLRALPEALRILEGSGEGGYSVEMELESGSASSGREKTSSSR